MSVDAIFLLFLAAIAVLFGGVLIWYLPAAVNPFKTIRPLKALLYVLYVGDGPLTLSNETRTSVLNFAQQVTRNGIGYTYLSDTTQKTIIMVQLPQQINAHLVAIGQDSGWQNGIKKIRIKRHLRELTLEGDFSRHIKMYCTKGREQDVLQIFDPADMQYFVDFCKAYDFEIYKDAIYISQSANAHDAADETSMTKDVQQFVDRNLTTLARI